MRTLPQEAIFDLPAEPAQEVLLLPHVPWSGSFGGGEAVRDAVRDRRDRCADEVEHLRGGPQRAIEMEGSVSSARLAGGDSGGPRAWDARPRTESTMVVPPFLLVAPFVVGEAASV